MELEVDLRRAPVGAQLLDPDDFGSFRVALVDDGEPLPPLEPAGVARLDEYAWIRVETLRHLAGARATTGWEESLHGMLEYARSRGWFDEELDAVRGHVVRRAGVTAAGSEEEVRAT